jgi:adenylate cyclase class 2
VPQESAHSPSLEVELKYPLTDTASVIRRLNQLGARELGLEHEQDIYFASPDRDFAKTDEALRLRRTANRLWLTYKGPRLDPLSKTREEIEVELKSPAVFEQACDLLEHLGYHIVVGLYKERRIYELDWRGYAVKVCLDNVSRLGQFVELENAGRPAGTDSGPACPAIARSGARLAAERTAILPGVDSGTIAAAPTR